MVANMCGDKWLTDWRKHTVHWILEFSDIFSILLGMLPFNFYHIITTAPSLSAAGSAKRMGHNNTVQKVLALIYIIVLLATIIGGIVGIVLTQTTVVVVEYFEEKPVSGFMNEVHSVLSLGATVFVLLRNWLLATAYARLVHNLQSLRFDVRFDVERCSAFDWYVLGGGTIRLLQNASTVHALLTLAPRWNVTHFVMTLLILLLSNVMYCVQYQFCFGVLHIYRYIWALNEQLLHIVQCGRCTPLDVDICRMTSVFMRLQRWSEQLMRHYDWQLLLAICLYINSNAVNMYNFCVVWAGKLHTLNVVSVLAFLQIVLINFLDFWYIIDVCALALAEAQRTSIVLNGFLEQPHYTLGNKQLQKDVEMLNLWRCCRPLTFSVKGLFDLNRCRSRQVFFITITYFILLVQYDFLNL